MITRKSGRKWRGAGLLALIVLGAFAGVRNYPFLLSEKTEKHLLELVERVKAYDADHKRLPVALNELVSGGYFPKTSALYRNPMVTKWPWPSAVSVEASDFEFVFAESAVEIRTKDRAHPFTKSVHNSANPKNRVPD